jgi:hypothetical protein
MLILHWLSYETQVYDILGGYSYGMANHRIQQEEVHTRWC